MRAPTHLLLLQPKRNFLALAGLLVALGWYLGLSNHQYFHPAGGSGVGDDMRGIFQSEESEPPKSHTRIEWCAGYPRNVPTESQDGIVALASFPGSGNTWARFLLQQATGFKTGSVYSDKLLRAKGFRSERQKGPGMLVVKTHAFTEEKSMNTEIFYKAILLVREPIGALKALFNMMHTSHRGHASETDYEQKWTPYLLEKLDKWTQFHLFWHGAFHNGTVTADDKIRRPEDLLIVRYEDLVENTEAELSRMLTFLRQHPSRDVMDCVMQNRDGLFKRKHGADEFDPYTPETREVVLPKARLVYDKLGLEMPEF